MEMRKKFLRSLPYLKDMSTQIIMQIIFKLREHTYEKDTYILRRGDMSEKVYIVWMGEVAVEVQKKSQENLPRINIGGNQRRSSFQRTHETYLNFDVLKRGSCFSAYAPFANDGELAQLVNFRVSSPKCVLLEVSNKQLMKIGKSHLDLTFRLK